MDVDQISFKTRVEVIGALVAVEVVAFLLMERDHGEKVDFPGRGKK